MKVEITPSQLWHNVSLMAFFMSTQARNTFEELANMCKGAKRQSALFNAIDDCYETLEEFEAVCYDYSPKDILKEMSELGYNVPENEDDL